MIVKSMNCDSHDNERIDLPFQNHHLPNKQGARLQSHSSPPRRHEPQQPHQHSHNNFSEGEEVIASELVHRMTKHPSQAELVKENITYQFQQTEQ